MNTDTLDLTLFAPAFTGQEPPTPPPAPPYSVGSFVYASWGYDQTNIDWFKVTARKGDWLTLTPYKALTHEPPGSFMSGTSRPSDEPTGGKPIRRRIYVRDGEERGMAFARSYGWISAWDGKPKGFSYYA